MKTRFLSMAAIAVLLLNVAGFAAGDSRRIKAKKRAVATARLVAALPASDGVVVFEAKRFLTDALPKVLSANQPMLAEIMAKITEMETSTGIDLRKFDQVAVGVSMKQSSPTNVDFDTVAIANGDINTGALIAVAKLASKGTYREEKIGERTVYVFTAKDVMQKSTVTVNNSKIAHVVDQALHGLTKEIAVIAFDKNTLVIGSLPKLRETIEGETHISTALSGLLSAKETSVISFALKAPDGASKMLPEVFDAVDKSIDSIRYLSGSLDIAAAGTSLQMMARSKSADEAAGLKDMLDVLRSFGGLIGGSKQADKQVYSRMIKNAKFGIQGTDVTLDLTVPQADIDTLIRGIK